MFSDLEKKSYSGRKIEFPGMAGNFELYDYQKEAVERIINEKNTLLAFDVGSGKTYIMIAAAMKMRQMGMSRKNMFVVPNNIVGQWEKIFTDLYPKAKLLTIDPKSFKLYTILMCRGGPLIWSNGRGEYFVAVTRMKMSEFSGIS